jgi:hypothetical protein
MLTTEAISKFTITKIPSSLRESSEWGIFYCGKHGYTKNNK